MIMDLEVQLKAAEARKSELEKAHAEALTALRNCGPDLLEARQSKVRELEKKIALETVRCEELQLELAASQRIRGQQHLTTASSPATAATAPTQWSSTAVGGVGTKGNEIERIMAKIEQDNRILAELDHSRSTTLGYHSNLKSHGINENSPTISPINASHSLPAMYSSVGLSGNPNTSVGFLTCNSNYNTSISSPYNTLAHSYSTKNSLIGSGLTTLTHQPTSIGLGHTSTSGVLGTIGIGQSVINQPASLGQTALGQLSSLGPISNLSSNLLGQNLGTSLGTTTTSANLGTSSFLGNTTLGTGFLPPSTYTTSSITNTSFPHNSTSLPQGTYNPNANFSHYTLPYNPIAPTTCYSNNVTFSNPLTSQFNTTNLTGPSAMSIKLKPYEEIELGGGRRAATPVTPYPQVWALGSSIGMSENRPMSRIMPEGLDSDWSGIHSSEKSYLNGHNIDGQVDMLDIPGKGRCSVYIVRFSYDPEPENEEELPVQAGDYILVWGEPIGAGGYLDAETLDGRRGLVPSHFAQRLLGDDLLEFHQAVLSTLREEEINAEAYAADLQKLNELAEMSEGQDDDSTDCDQVPAPRNLTLERQLNKSVLIGWTAPEVGPGNQIESYHVYVDGVLKTTIKATERTRALVEGVDSNRPHRISVRSVTANRRTSRDAACTMIIGRDTHQLGPTAVRAKNVTATSAVISWLPANSNHQHVVCVNNVEVRTVKPGVYRHTITGLTPNTQYRVTVRAKHQRHNQNVLSIADDLPMPAAAHTDFRTLPKGLPDPPSDIMVEPGPQDGTLLVTWHPVQSPHHVGSTITGYSVFADGKKVTDIDSPTGDHALIDISKLLGLNPRHVTVRTKARDSQSADSIPTPIPPNVLRGGAVRARQKPHSAVPMHIRQSQGNPQQRQQPGDQQRLQIIEHDENLSDKEIFPNSNVHRQQAALPSIAQRSSVAEITKESFETNLSEDELPERRGQRQQRQQYQSYNQQQSRSDLQQPIPSQQQQQSAQQQLQQQQQQQQQQQYFQQSPQGQRSTRVGQQGQMGRNTCPQNQQMNNQQMVPNQPPVAQKRARWFVALFDYDPSTMSPNPDACEEELPFNEGDTIKVWGDKDADGFYWGECRGRRGYVPHNMVMEVEGGGQNRDRWGDIYANMPVKKMVALYDYDPQELSPNVDAEVELSFTTGQIINVYGEMDDDGFYMAEIDGMRGLVPSNFLTEAPDQYGGGQTSQTMGPPGRNQKGRGHGPGARGPPPPPRDGRQRKTDACPTVLPSQLDNVNTSTPNTQAITEHYQGKTREGVIGRGGNMSTQSTNQQNYVQGGFVGQTQFSGQGVGGVNQSQFGSSNQYGTNQQSFGVSGQQTFGGGSSQQALPSSSQQTYGGGNQQAFTGSGGGQTGSRLIHKGVPHVVPMLGNSQQQQQQQQANQQGPNLMQKINEITAPGGDILSKGKELIFMKFGLGGK